MNETWIDHYRVGAVSLFEMNEGHGPWFVVIDPNHYRVRFFPDRESNTVSVGFDAEWSDTRPGEMANYTPSYETAGADCQLNDVTISDDGLLSVLPRKRSASHVVIRWGWTAQLPIEAVEPIRRAIALVEAALSERNV